MKTGIIVAILALALIAVVYILRKRSTTVVSVPQHAAAPVSSTASELSSIASLASAGTSIFTTLYNSSSDSDD